MSWLVETLVVAAARQLVLTRSVVTWYGIKVYTAACKVGLPGLVTS